MWSTALALPNLFVFHQGDQFAAAATQLIIVIAVALFVGYRVEEERLARRQDSRGAGGGAAPHRPGAPRRDAPAGSGRAATAARDRGDAAVRRRHGSRHCEPGAVDYRGPHGLLARLYAPVASPRTGRAWRGHLSPPPGGRVP